jgi:hypothetical protein
MLTKPFFFALIALAIASLACSITLNLPQSNVKTGPLVTEDIAVPLLPDSQSTAAVTLEFGAGELILNPGAEGQLVSGTATYNVAEFKPTLTTQGNQVTISQKSTHFNGIPNLGNDFQNKWDLKLGPAELALRISAGAYRGQYELGGLSLQSVSITDGAADARLSFSEPNQVDMSELRYETGASQVTLTGLANANFSQMIFKSGAGNYSLDFSGSLRQAANIDIETGLSQLVISVPQGTPAHLTVDSGLSRVSASGNWHQDGTGYSLPGNGPALEISVKTGAGSLELRNP